MIQRPSVDAVLQRVDSARGRSKGLAAGKSVKSTLPVDSVGNAIGTAELRLTAEQPYLCLYIEDNALAMIIEDEPESCRQESFMIDTGGIKEMQ